MIHIKRATAIYTGGGIYLFYAEQENGNWIMGDGTDLTVVNTSPLADEETFEASGYVEWQDEHKVEYIHEESCQQVLNEILNTIFNGYTIKGWDNFQIGELKKYFKSVPQI